MRDHYKNMMIELLKDENTVITSGKSFYDLKRPDELYYIIEFTKRQVFFSLFENVIVLFISK